MALATALQSPAAAAAGEPVEGGGARLRGVDTVGDGKPDSLDTTGDGRADTSLSAAPGAAAEPAVDLYRDTLLRYMGYCNEVGESFRPLLPRFVVPSYVLSIGYVCADTQDKARKAYAASAAASPTRQADTTFVLEQAGDCMVWQLLASVFVPGFVIHKLVKFVGWGLRRGQTVPALARTWVPTLAGLAAIPFIIHPIDHSVDFVLDQ